MCRDLIMKAIEADVRSTTLRAILAILAKRARPTTGITWVSIPTIAREAPCSVGTTRNTLCALIADKHVSRLEIPGWPSIIAVHPVRDGVRQVAPKLSVATVRENLRSLSRRAPGIFERVVLWLAEIGLIDINANELKQIALDYARKTSRRSRQHTPPNIVGVAGSGASAEAYNISPPPLQILTETPTNFEDESTKEPLNEPLASLSDNPDSFSNEPSKVASSNPADSANRTHKKRQHKPKCVAQQKIDPIEEFRKQLTPEQLQDAEARRIAILASRNRPRSNGLSPL